MTRRISFEVGDETFRDAKVLAVQADTSLSGAMRTLVKLWRSDTKLQERVRRDGEPLRRPSRVGSDE